MRNFGIVLVFCSICFVYGQQSKLKIFISYDIPPSNLSQNYLLLSSNKATFRIKEETDLKPGKYILQIYEPGYQTITQRINVVEGEVTKIKQQLLALPRQIKLHFQDQQGSSVAVKIHRIFCIESGMDIFLNQQFMPGDELNIRLELHEYSTVNKTIQIVPGVLPQVIKIPLTKLKKYLLYTDNKKVDLDGLEYDESLFVDGVKIDDHLIKYRQIENGYECELWLPESFEKLQVKAGYLSGEIPRSRLRNSLPSLRIFNLDDFIKHLNEISLQKSHIASFKVVKNKFQTMSMKRRLQKLSKDDIHKLLDLLQEWKRLPGSYTYEINELIHEIEKIVDFRKE